MNIRADAAVVGLGAMGAAVLYQLAKRGVDVVGVDQYSPPHELGSSHGETRITRCAAGEGAHYAPLALASHRIWRELEGATGQTLFDACGCLIISHGAAQSLQHGKTDFLDRTIACAGEVGVPLEIIDGAEVRRRFPMFLAPDEAKACFEPGGGFVYPERCIEVQLSEAERHGARIFRDTVQSVSQSGGIVRIECKDTHTDVAHAIVAAGAWTGTLLGAPFDALLKPYRQALQWFPVNGEMYAPARCPSFIWLHGPRDEDIFYGFPALPGTSLLKAATERYDSTTTPEMIARSVSPQETSDFHRQHLAARLVGVGATAAKSMACLYTVTPDGDFIIDAHPTMDRVTVISACSGHGFKHSAAIGERIAASIMRREPDPALARFSLSRFAAGNDCPA